MSTKQYRSKLEIKEEKYRCACPPIPISQATLEQVKASKDSLAREFLEAQESWRQERILRGTEREKLEEEVDARKRLESLLAAEREKEKVGLARTPIDQGTEERRW